MSINARLLVLVVASVLLTLLIAAATAINLKAQDDNHKRVEKSSEIQLGISLVRTYFNMHERYKDRKSIENAIAQHHRLRDAINDLNNAVGNELVYINSIRQNIEGLSFLLEEMLSVHSGGELSEIDIKVHQHLLDRMNNNLLAMADDGFRLSHYTLSNSWSSTKKSSYIVATVLFLATLLTIYIALKTLYVFRDNINKLHLGIEKTSSGQLDADIYISENNELSELAKNLNRMQENLKRTMITNDELQQEVSERTRELENQKKNLKNIAEHDNLTGLPNRGFFLEALKHTLDRCERQKSIAAVFFIDLDKFKHINDSLGHDVGDIALKNMATRFQSVLRKSDLLARIGGDEFTVIAEPLESPEDAALIADKLLQSLAPACTLNGNLHYLHCSIGISIYPDDGIDCNSLMKHSDSAMYKAKQINGNSFLFYNRSMTDEVIYKIQLEAELRSAILHRQFEVFYQPQIDLTTNKLFGLEALIRWRHPEKGLTLPINFIAHAEERGLIIDIGSQFVGQVFSQFSQWKEQTNDCILAINISIQQLTQNDFVKNLERKLNTFNIPGELLELEITEGHLIHDIETTLEQLKALKHLGITICLDDFGTGYSSLAHLKRLPISKLKIDQSFIAGFIDNPENKAICQTIIALAKALKLSIVAEGVETNDQAENLKLAGCDQAQGFLYSRALPAEKIHELYFNQS